MFNIQLYIDSLPYHTTRINNQIKNLVSFRNYQGLQLKDLDCSNNRLTPTLIQ